MIRFMFILSIKRCLYNLSFTNVGLGKGNYIALNRAMQMEGFFNGLHPVNGIKQGDWDPVILLVTPKKHDVITAAAQYYFTKNLH